MAWAATRLLTAAALVLFEASLLEDPMRWLAHIDQRGVAQAFPEYPWPAVGLLSVPIAFGALNLYTYGGAVLLGVLVADAGFAWLLWRAAGRRASAGLWLWLLAVPAIGPLILARYDILPGVLAAAALLALQRGAPAAAGACTALGIGLKVWPALGLPALLVPGSAGSRARLIGGLLGAGAALAAATVAAAGVERLWSPLTVQLNRGLQIEAFAALPLHWLRYVDGGVRWSTVDVEACACIEVAGPGTGTALAAASAAALAGGAALAWLHLRALRAPDAARSVALAGLLVILVVLLSVATSRVFSPQYMIWLAALLAALGALPGGMLERGDAVLFLGACLLTHLLFPFGYPTLYGTPRGFGHFAMLVALTLRDALLVALG
ncbi:MAG TPA: hypothetical protein VF110_17415, partial [Burkholderiales bacterium]